MRDERLRQIARAFPLVMDVNNRQDGDRVTKLVRGLQGKGEWFAFEDGQVDHKQFHIAAKLNGFKVGTMKHVKYNAVIVMRVS